MKPFTKETLADLTPDRALALLKEGNIRFLKGEAKNDYLSQKGATTTAQHPFAVVLGCIDSRVPHEIIFDQGIGHLFSVRVAGNVVNEDILGSIEYATKVVGTKLIVVLGHSKCGAVAGACDGVELGNITGLLSKIKPAIDKETVTTDNRNSSNDIFLSNVIGNNVRMSIECIRLQSPIIRTLETEGNIKIVGATYDVKTGDVDFMG